MAKPTYAYVGNDPINAVDPSGLEGELEGAAQAAGQFADVFDFGLTLAGILLTAYPPTSVVGFEVLTVSRAVGPAMASVLE